MMKVYNYMGQIVVTEEERIDGQTYWTNPLYVQITQKEDTEGLNFEFSPFLINPLSTVKLLSTGGITCEIPDGPAAEVIKARYLTVIEKLQPSKIVRV